MKKDAFVALILAFMPSVSVGDDDASQIIEIKGFGNANDANKLNTIWLYPEDYEGKTVKLAGFLFEPENFEFFPELDGYLFSCEPVVYGRNNIIHCHVGNAMIISQEKLNFFCSAADGKRIRQLFKERKGDVAMPAEVVLKVEKRGKRYFGVVASIKPQTVHE